jgi:hypothetical protein
MLLIEFVVKARLNSVRECESRGGMMGRASWILE